MSIKYEILTKKPYILSISVNYYWAGEITSMISSLSSIAEICFILIRDFGQSLSTEFVEKASNDSTIQLNGSP